MPALVDMLRPDAGDDILDLGCGAGAFAEPVVAAGANYTGVDLSPKLVALARKSHHGSRFAVGDATRLADTPGLTEASYDGVSFLLSLQDINPLGAAIESAAWALRPSGRLAILLVHPCFRVPRQSGWGWDAGRRLVYRRVDSYLGILDVPMQKYGGGKSGTTRSFHRPLHVYSAALWGAGFVIERLVEVPAPPPTGPKQERRADRLAREQIPLFLGLAARLT